jgi:hypothetical protein
MLPTFDNHGVSCQRSCCINAAAAAAAAAAATGEVELSILTANSGGYGLRNMQQ